MHYSTTTLLAVFASLLATSSAADFAVAVGPALTFTPDHVSGAAAGDTVTFSFTGGSHTVTQSTLATPCTKFPGGFDSGVGTGQYRVTVNGTAPLWIYCATPGHCKAGMVFAINAASDADLATFRQNAMNPSAATTGAASGTSSTGTSTSTSSVAGGNSGGSGYGGGGGGYGSAAFSVAGIAPAAIVGGLLASIAGLVM